MRNNLFIAFAIIFFLAACGPPAPKLRPASSYSGPLNSASIEKRVHTLINRERTSKGFSPLKFDPKLSSIARGHSRDMSARGYFSHNSLDGRDFSYRYDKGGFECRVKVGSTIYMGAENIFNIMFTGAQTAEQIANSTVNGWMDSKGHRKNILTPHWGREGIGVFIGLDGNMVVVYITQNFC